MPVPTDTFWNIKRLNRIFAVSALLLLGTVVWSVWQDYSKDWRQPQQAGRVWEAALVEEKLEAAQSPDLTARLQSLQAELEQATKDQSQTADQIAKLQSELKKIDSDRATLEFRLNSIKSNVMVDESHLQDAIAGGDSDRIEKLTRRLENPRAEVARATEELAQLKSSAESKSEELKTLTSRADQYQRQITQATSEIDLMRKREQSLQPGGFGKLSTLIRQTPLLQFINPADKVQQIVLPDIQTDVAFLKITTIDRCTTCHVNIAKKDFSEENILAYLEEQLATSRNLALPDKPAKPTDPAATRTVPGPVAMPEFWHEWTQQLNPIAMTKGPSVFRLRTLSNSIATGKAQLKFDGKDWPAFLFAPDPAKKEDPNHSLSPFERADVILALVRAWSVYDSKSGSSHAVRKATIQIPAGLEDKVVQPIKNVAWAYIENIRMQLLNAISDKQKKDLLNRYRYALVREVNVFRTQRGLRALDPSPVQLAHPKLDLYVDIDSKHSYEAVGCTSCHDGSGLETDFVLAAHKARPIWVDSKTGEPVLARQLHLSAKGAPKLPHQPNNTLASMLESVAPAHEPIPAYVDELQINLDKSNSDHAENAPNETPPIPYSDPITRDAGTAVSQMTHWVAKYEPTAPRSFKLVYHEWDRPMLSSELLQANCVRCHTEVYDIKETAPKLFQGRALFTRMGCVNCHQMDSIPAEQNRKVGTDLRQVTAKLSPAFINSWIWSPKAFRPSTKMPHFFMLENCSSEEELRRTKQEVRAITEYLVQTATPRPPMHTVDPSIKANADKGKTLFTSLGCQGCHSNTNDVGEQWITNDLVKAKGLDARQAGEAFGKMTYNQRQIYIKENFEPPEGTLASLPKYADGSAKPVFVHHGPELSGIGTKLLAGRSTEQAKAWLFDWLKDPRHYSDHTMMPRLRLDDQQAADLTEYLLAQTRNKNAPDDKYVASLTTVDPEKLRELTSLFMRARFSPNRAYEVAADESELARLAEDAITTPAFNNVLAKEKVKTLSLQQKQMVFLGKKLIAHYGCMNCHAINGAETIASPCANLSDWGQKGIDKLDFGYLDHHKAASLPPTTKIPLVNGLSVDAALLAHGPSTQPTKALDVAWPHVDHTRVDWLEHKLQNSRIWDRGKVLLEPTVKDGKTIDSGKPYDKLKMPTFYLNDQEVQAISAFVLSNRDRLVSERLAARMATPEAKTIARGRELVERFNCIGCHQVELNQPQVQQWYREMDKAPPSLRGEGNKTQHDWLFNFFKNVEPLRPLMFNGIRMPSFHATDDEWTAIIAYFNAVSNKESAELKRLITPVEQYIAARSKLAPTTMPTGFSPGQDWSTQPAFATTVRALKEWALARKQATEVEFDPAKNTPAELANTYRKVLFKAHFTARLYDSPFPFVDQPRPMISEARFKLGEQFFHEMQCLSCHRMGDENAPGGVPDPKAPNLARTGERLQRRWSRHWAQEPPVIQPGTNMPAIFSGLSLFEPRGLDWASATAANDKEKIARTQQLYGKTADEQSDLLWDFVYAASARNYTSVQPSKGPTTSPATRSTQPAK